MMNIPIQWGRGFAGSLADDAGVETDGRIQKKETKRDGEEKKKKCNERGWRGEDQEVVDEVRLESERGRGEVRLKMKTKRGYFGISAGCLYREIAVTSHTCNGNTAEIH